jgi:hypothetical protein
MEVEDKSKDGQGQDEPGKDSEQRPAKEMSKEMRDDLAKRLEAEMMQKGN